jgi:hypothetical protein
MSSKGTDLDAQHSKSTPSKTSTQSPPPQNGSPRAVSRAMPLPLDSSVSTLAMYCTRLPNSSINSFCGALGGVASGIVTCPLDVIKTRLQAQGAFNQMKNKNPAGPALYHGMIGTAKTIWVQDGVRGMYRGLGPMLLGYLPTWAVYMSVYDGSREYYSTKVGAYMLCPIHLNRLTNSDIRRKQMVRPYLRLDNSRRMLDPSHKPDLGDQNPSHVASRCKCSRSGSNTVAVQIHSRCRPENVPH